MKAVIIILFLNMLFFSCNKQTQDKTDVVIIDEPIISNEIIEPQETEEEKQRKAELRKQLDKMTLHEIIDFYIINNRGIIVGIYNQDKDIGYFKFLSHEQIQWNHDSGGFTYIPYLYIVDDTNIRIEVFNYNVGGGSLPLGTYLSASKYYVYITKDDLINLFLRDIRYIENFKIISYIEINKFQRDELKFKLLIDTDIYSDGTLEEKMKNIRKNTEVEIIDMYYNDLKEKFPISVRIKNGNLDGWINVEHIDFLKKEIHGNNGIWLNNSVKNALIRYGEHSVTAKIASTSIPLRKLPSNNSEQLFLLPVDQWDSHIPYYIEDVSANIDVIDGIEAAWYKVYKFVEYDDMEVGYEINGWIFGGFLSINENINSDEF